MPDNNDGETTIDSDAEAREAAEVWKSAVAAGDTVDEEEFEAGLREDGDQMEPDERAA